MTVHIHRGSYIFLSSVAIYQSFLLPAWVIQQPFSIEQRDDQNKTGRRVLNGECVIEGQLTLRLLLESLWNIYRSAVCARHAVVADFRCSWIQCDHLAQVTMAVFSRLLAATTRPIVRVALNSVYLFWTDTLGTKVYNLFYYYICLMLCL